ncbi:hypothetical protein KQ873_02130 [Mycoplasma zalophidermidis]|uniref:hypothetical protein n=1 Tax=Mycoplasma zalophidermidis TaxID=398174 RepID=UPI001C0FAB01|nr:hypothetical protein [Mycoplasma zalophidermidis]MBU4689836.1 hypothetical protein [Mycoplasma zalophidermidis]
MKPKLYIISGVASIITPSVTVLSASCSTNPRGKFANNSIVDKKTRKSIEQLLDGAVESLIDNFPEDDVRRLNADGKYFETLFSKEEQLANLFLAKIALIDKKILKNEKIFNGIKQVVIDAIEDFANLAKDNKYLSKIMKDFETLINLDSVQQFIQILIKTTLHKIGDLQQLNNIGSQEIQDKLKDLSDDFQKISSLNQQEEVIEINKKIAEWITKTFKNILSTIKMVFEHIQQKELDEIIHDKNKLDQINKEYRTIFNFLDDINQVFDKSFNEFVSYLDRNKNKKQIKIDEMEKFFEFVYLNINIQMLKQ